LAYIYFSHISVILNLLWPIVHSECLHALAILQEGTGAETALLPWNSQSSSEDKH